MNRLVVIAGPTAVGKSALSIKLSKKLGGEVISADSMQVYKGMDIGTAKLKREEMQGIPHYLIDCLEPSEEFNVYVFKRLAKEALSKIYENGNIPVIAGGTGFYIQALLYDISFTEEDNKDIRKRLTTEASEKGQAYLYERLKALDPEYAAGLHQNNVKKVIRALEYMELNAGKKFSEHNNEEREKKSPYDFKYFVINDHREKLYENIDRRVDKMFEEGLLDEVRALYEKGFDKSLTSMQGLGYKEIIDCFNGLCTVTEAKERIKRETRHFAKRQLTWFRREKDVIWVNKYEFGYDEDRIVEHVIDCVGR